MEGLIKGLIVHYILSPSDVDEIVRRRNQSNGLFTGNPVHAGDWFPMTITTIWSEETTIVNGQVHLDGNDTLWVTHRVSGNREGNWLYYEIE